MMGAFFMNEEHRINFPNDWIICEKAGIPFRIAGTNFRFVRMNFPDNQIVFRIARTSFRIIGRIFRITSNNLRLAGLYHELARMNLPCDKIIKKPDISARPYIFLSLPKQLHLL